MRYYFLKAFAVFLFSPFFLLTAAEEINSCALCHPEQGAKFGSGVHDSGGISCVDCHGGDSQEMDPGIAMSKEKDFVGKPFAVCGKCHTGEQKQFADSPHAALDKESGFSGCSSCHGKHAIKEPDADLYDVACLKCHDKDSEEGGYAGLFKDISRSNGRLLRESGDIIAKAEADDLFVDSERAILADIKSEISAIRVNQHTLSRDKLAGSSQKVADMADKISRGIEEKREQMSWRKWALVPIWIFIIFMVVLLRKAQNRLNGDDLRGKDTSRRDFLGLLIKGGASALLLAFIAPAIAYIWPVARRKEAQDRVKVGEVEDFPVWGAKKAVINGSPILVIRVPDGFRAFSAICTHLGCIVEWNGTKREIDCPCHAGVFDINGNVLSGPPPRPLPSYDVQIVENEVFVKI